MGGEARTRGLHFVALCRSFVLRLKGTPTSPPPSSLPWRCWGREGGCPVYFGAGVCVWTTVHTGSGEPSRLRAPNLNTPSFTLPPCDSLSLNKVLPWLYFPSESFHFVRVYHDAFMGSAAAAAAVGVVILFSVT